MERQYEVTIAAMSLPELSAWLVVGTDGAPQQRLYRMFSSETSGVTTESARPVDATLSITDTAKPDAPGDDFTDGEQRRTWRFSAKSWSGDVEVAGERKLLAERPLEDLSWRGVGKTCQQIVDEAKLQD